MILHMKTYSLAAIAALVLIAPRTAVAGSVQIHGLNIDANSAWELSAGGDDRDKLDAAITNEVDPVAMAALAGYATKGELAIAIANIPDETDPRAMKLYHYGDPDIEITPAGAFGFDPLTGEITGYTGTNPDIVLPYEINGVPVVVIGVDAFHGNDVIRKLLAPKTLTTIDRYAFAFSPLTTLTAPSLTHIGNQAFAECPLTNINAPSLTSIGDYAFEGSSLTSIYYGGNQPTAGANIYNGAPTNLVNYVTSATATGWGDMFGDRPVVRLPLYADEVYIGGELAATQPYVNNAIANIPGGDIPGGTDTRAMKLYHYGDPDIEITPAGYFGFDPLTGEITGYTGTNPDIVLPYEINGVPVVAIGVGAFEYNSIIRTLKAPKTLTSIGNGAFEYSFLTTLTAPALTTTDRRAFYQSSLTTLVAPALTSIGDSAFYRSSLITLTAPSLTTLGDNAFYESSLETLIAPSLTTIGSGAFANSSLTTLTAPALTSIGGDAFYNSSLTTLTAPALTTIGDSAFSYSPLTSIYYGGNQPTAGAGIYRYSPTNLVSYVTNPTATGWGDNFGGRPVVRLPLYADAVYSGGSLVSTVSPSSPWTTNIVASGAQTLKGTWGSQPRLQLSGSTTVDIDWTTYDTNGINRITLTIVSGEHSVTWSTNNIEFATAPELSTTGSSTILIRKVGTEKAQGRQL